MSFRNELEPRFLRLAEIARKLCSAEHAFILLPVRFPEVKESQELEVVGISSSLLQEGTMPSDLSWSISVGSGTLGQAIQTLAPTIISGRVPLGDRIARSTMVTPFELPWPPERKPKLIGAIVVANEGHKELQDTDAESLVLIELELLEIIKSRLIERHTGSPASDWNEFLRKVSVLSNALGVNESIYCKISISYRPNRTLAESVEIHERLFNIVRQTVPPLFPQVRLPDGEILVALDPNMANYFAQRIEEACVGSISGVGEISVEMVKEDIVGGLDIRRDVVG